MFVSMNLNKNFKKIFSGFLAILMPSLIVFAQSPEDSVFMRRMSDEILDNGKAYGNLRVLCKTIGQRLSGSLGMYKAEKWGLQALQQAGADTVYMQECMVPHWVRGNKEVLRLVGKGSKASRQFNILALGNSEGTGPKGIKAQVVAVNNFDELIARKNDVKGKIVFFNYPYNKKLYGGAYGDAVRYRSNGAWTAAKYGAVAVIIRSVTGATDDHPHTGAMRYVDSFPKIPAVAISTNDAPLLWDISKKQPESLFYLQTNCRMLPDTIGHNIIGELWGSEYADEIITVGGHLDSWDPAEGAHDDGAGMVQSIEIIRVLKSLGYKPKRTIRIVLFANEENGLRGGVKYAEVAKQKGEKHVMAMESDGGGETPRGLSCGMNEQQYAKVETWKKLFAQFNIADFPFEKNSAQGADISPLKRAYNHPQFGLYTVGNRYFDYHHAAIDVFENVNERELNLGAVVMASMVYLVDKYGL